jgi:hypothetical protein
MSLTASLDLQSSCLLDRVVRTGYTGELVYEGSAFGAGVAFGLENAKDPRCPRDYAPVSRGRFSRTVPKPRQLSRKDQSTKDVFLEFEDLPK